MPAIACPQREILHRLLRGELSLPECEQLAQHLEECAPCTAVARTLSTDDTLVSAVRAPVIELNNADSEAVQRLIGRLLREGPPRSEAGVSLDATTTDPTPAEQGPVPEIADFLTPPRAPGEIGWLGGYRILQVMGSGGMGVVFRAEDPQLCRPVALKAMRPALAASASAGKRFLLEAQATAAIRHDHIVTIYQVGQERGVPFLAMELLEGESLEERLKRTGPLPLPEALRIGREIALGLAAAHRRGLIHRDIKPGNVWLEQETGRVKILDFGLARASGTESHLTQSGAIVGTPAYMAPEQARGEPVDSRCDLFSLGCVLYRMLTGQPPFQGKDTMSMLLALAMDHPRPPRQLRPEISPALNNLILRLLAKNVPDRPSSALAVVKAIETIEHTPAAPVALPLTQPTHQGSKPADDATLVGARPSTAPPRRPGRRRSVVAEAAAAAAILVAGIVIIIHGPGEKKERIERPEAESAEVRPNPPHQVPPGPGPGKPEENRKPPRPLMKGASPFDLLDPKDIPTSERFGWQPKELVAVLGTHRQRHWHDITAVFFTPDGKSLVSGTRETICIWDVASGREQRSFKSEGTSPFPHSLSSDGHMFATTSGVGHPISLWRLDSGRRRTLMAEGSGYCLAFSPTDPFIAIGGVNINFNEVAIVNVITEKRVATLKGHKYDVRDVVFSPDGKLLASASMGDSLVKLWDAATWKEKAVLTNGAWGSVAISPDSKLLAYAGGEGIELWDVQAGKRRGGLAGSVQSATVAPYHLVFSPDGKTLAGTGHPGYGTECFVALVDVPSASIRAMFMPWRGYTGKIAYSPDGNFLATAVGNQVRLRDARTGEERFTLRDHKDSVHTVAYSADGQRLATAGADHTVKVWDARTGKRIHVLEGHTEEVCAVAWHPDRKTLATGGRDGKVKLWDTITAKEKWSKEGHLSWIHGLAFSADGTTLASASKAGEVKLWGVTTGELRFKLDRHDGAVRSVVFAPDGRTLATASEDRTARLWEVTTGKELGVFKGHTAAVTGVSFHPQGKMLATASMDGTVRLWDAATKAEKARRVNDGPTSGGGMSSYPVHGVSFAPGGNMLAAACGDGSVRLWRTESDEDCIALPGHNGPVLSVSFSPDGQTLASAGQDGIVKARRTPRDIPSWPVPGGTNRVVAVAGDGKLLILKRDQRFRVWDVAARKERFSPLSLLKLTINFWGNADECRLMPDNKRFGFLTDSGWRTWDLDADKEQGSSLPMPVSRTAYSPDGATIVVYGTYCNVVLYDAATRAVRCTILEREASVGFSLDSKTIFTANPTDGKVKAWEAASGKLKQTFNVKFRKGFFLPDGQTLAFTPSDTPNEAPSAKLWDLRTNKELAVIPNHYGTGCSHDGKTLALCRQVEDSQHILELRDVPNGKLRKTLRGFKGNVRIVVFSPDNQHFVTGSEDGQVALRDASGNIERHWTLPALPSSILFAPDGRHLILNNTNQTVYILRLALPNGKVKP